MSTNHEHTPLTDTVREVYSFAGAQAPSVRKQWFDRWLATVEAAAEQRGAIKALRDAAEDYGHKELDDRADLLEGDDERS